MLDRLVLSDRAIENDARLCIARGARQRGVSETDRFRGDQDAFGIHAVKNVFEAAALLAETVSERDFKIFKKQFVGIDGLAAHLLDLMDGNSAAVEIGIEEAQAMGRIPDLLKRGGAREQQN